MTNQLASNLKEKRKKLKLSQEYVASLLGVHRTAITAIESGNRKVTAEELSMFSKIFGVSINNLLNGEKETNDIRVFARLYDDLSEVDKREINNLIRYKLEIKKSDLRNGG